MKIYYDSCQCMVALRKHRKLFDAAYNIKLGLSTCSDQAEMPAVVLPLLREDEACIPHFFPSALWPPPALE